MSSNSSTGVDRTVPRLAEYTAGWLGRARLLVRTRQSALAASTVRISVPRFPAYSTPSATRTSDELVKVNARGFHTGSRAIEISPSERVLRETRASNFSEIR